MANPYGDGEVIASARLVQVKDFGNPPTKTDWVAEASPATDWYEMWVQGGIAYRYLLDEHLRVCQERNQAIADRDSAIEARQCAQDDGKRWRKVNAELRDELTEARQTIKALGQRIYTQRRMMRKRDDQVRVLMDERSEQDGVIARQRSVIDGLYAQLGQLNGLLNDAMQNKTTLSEAELMDQIKSLKAARDALSALAERQGHRIDAMASTIDNLMHQCRNGSDGAK